jgi:hypothetical protein
MGTAFWVFSSMVRLRRDPVTSARPRDLAEQQTRQPALTPTAD